MGVLDLLKIGVLLLIFCITTILAFQLYSGYHDALPSVMRSTVMDNIHGNARVVLTSFDYLFLFILFGLAGGVAIGAYYLRTHPVFFVFSLLVLAVVVVILAQVANAFMQFGTNPIISASASNFPIMAGLWSNAGLVFVILGFIILIALYSKTRSESGLP